MKGAPRTFVISLIRGTGLFQSEQTRSCQHLCLKPFLSGLRSNKCLLDLPFVVAWHGVTSVSWCGIGWTPNRDSRSWQQGGIRGCRLDWILRRPKSSIYCTSSISMKNITTTSSLSVGISQVPQSPLQASPMNVEHALGVPIFTEFQNACRRGGGSRVGEDWRLATRSCRTKQWHNRAIGTGCTGARGRDSPHGGAQSNLRLSSRLDGADRDERLANTGSSDRPLWLMSFHPDVREPGRSADTRSGDRIRIHQRATLQWPSTR